MTTTPVPLCLCCESHQVSVEPTLTSLFLSRAAWGGKPEITNLLYCRDCGFRTFQRMLSVAEANHYYQNYRGDDYIRERGKDEIFYNQNAYDRDKAWMASPRRQEELLKLIGPQCTINMKVLDFGGNDGRLIYGINAPLKAVFDLSESPALPGLKKISSESELHQNQWDLIICAQTLEHISRPDRTLAKLSEITSKGGMIYVELPCQNWESYAFDGTFRNLLLALAQKYRWLHKLLDFYSTGFRVKVEVLPPFGFVPMREHVNFFTLESVEHLGRKLGLAVEHGQINPFCGIQVLFRKI